MGGLRRDRDESVEAAIGEILAKAGRVGLLVNKARITLAQGRGIFARTWKSLFDVDLFGVIRTIKAVFPAMRWQRSGHIVNISSMRGPRRAA